MGGSSTKSRVQDYAPPKETPQERHQPVRIREDTELRVEEDEGENTTDFLMDGRKKPRVINRDDAPQPQRIAQRKVPPRGSAPAATPTPQPVRPRGGARRLPNAEDASPVQAVQDSSPAVRIAPERRERGRLGQAKTVQFPDVLVSISSRKILAHWVRLGRQVLKDKLAQTEKKSQKPKKKVRVEKLVDMFLDSQEELERMCLEDPEELIHFQIELLTRRIRELEDELLAQFRSAEKAKAAADEKAKAAAEAAAKAAARAAAEAPKISAVQQAREARALWDQQIMDWDTVFDRAVAKREHWKKNRGQQEDMAHQQWRKKAVMRQPTLATEDAKAGKSEVAEQLRKERENLQDVLARFEAQQQRQRRLLQQPQLDLAEALHEEQRQAMAERAAELRMERQKAAERKRKEELRRQAAELERQRLEEEERRREEEERDRQALERLKREKQESERRRLEERRLAAEREEQQRKEMEEKFRRAEEARREREEKKRREAARLEEERRKEAEKKLEEERKREEARLAEERRKEEERLAEERRREQARLEEERRREEARLEEERRLREERRREEEERRRHEEERRLQEEERLEQERREAERLEMERREESLQETRHGRDRQGRIDNAFDTLEDACDSDEDMEDGPDGPDGPGRRKKGRSAADWASRALLALDGDSDEEDDEDDEEEENTEADMQLVKLTGAIAKKIDRIHNHWCHRFHNVSPATVVNSRERKLFQWGHYSSDVFWMRQRSFAKMTPWLCIPRCGSSDVLSKDKWETDDVKT